MQKFFSLCLQGNINSAMEYLRSIQPKTEKMKEIEQQFIHRFYSANEQEAIPSIDSWIRNVISAYHNYFRNVLTNQHTIDEAETVLMEKLNNLVQAEQSLDMDSIEEELAARFSDKGYYFLGGITPPFRGPYIWKKVETLQLDVDIPYARQSVTVHMLSDFLLESWIGFATCENKTVGGWAKEDGLYCNAKRYESIESEEFQISYLKHEAQHLYDYHQFPDLEPRELEYRAKLVELIYTKNHSILQKFLMEAKNNPAFPHSFASYFIIKNLSSVCFNKEYEADIHLWLEKDYQNIAVSARQLFERSTRELKLKINQ